MMNLVELLTEVGDKFWMTGRLNTYKQWPFKPEQGICTAERMAAAGFVVIENEDETAEVSVECFFCNKQLDGWEPNDDPWEEHVKHQKMCPFVALNKQNEMEWTVDDLCELVKAYYLNQTKREMDKIINEVRSECKTTGETIPRIFKEFIRSRSVKK